MKGDVGISHHEKEREQEDAYTHPYIVFVLSRPQQPLCRHWKDAFVLFSLPNL